MTAKSLDIYKMTTFYVTTFHMKYRRSFLADISLKTAFKNIGFLDEITSLFRYTKLFHL